MFICQAFFKIYVSIGEDNLRVLEKVVQDQHRLRFLHLLDDQLREGESGSTIRRDIQKI